MTAKLFKKPFSLAALMVLSLLVMMLHKPAHAAPFDKDQLQAIKGNLYFDTGETLQLNEFEQFKAIGVYRLNGTYTAPGKPAVPIACSWGVGAYVASDIGAYFCRADEQILVFHYVAAGVVEVIASNVRFKFNNERTFGYVGFGSPLVQTAWADPNGLVYLPSVMVGVDRFTAYLQRRSDGLFQLLSAVKISEPAR